MAINGITVVAVLAEMQKMSTNANIGGSISTNRVVEMQEQGLWDSHRHQDWLDVTQLGDRGKITIVGVGGIGSHVAVALSKLGIPELTLIDPDIVELHNVPNQFFRLESVGLNKVDALAHDCDQYGASAVRSFKAKVGDNGFEAEEGNVPRPRGIVISALDSMEARNNLWDTLKTNPLVELLIDARLGGENIVVYTANPFNEEDVGRYKDTLYSDEEARPDPCTRRSVIDVGYGVTAQIVRLVRLFLKEEPIEHTIYYDHARLQFMTGNRDD